MSSLFKGLNIVLSLMLVFAAIGVAFIAFPVFGNQALIVRSGSMAPAIDVGSIVVVRKEKELISPSPLKAPTYKEGEIVSFKSQNNPKILTSHRIVDAEVTKDGTFYLTKGDANETLDEGLLSEKQILGKAYFNLPYLGKVLAFAKSPIGFPVLIIIPAVFVILMETFNIVKEVKKNRRDNADSQLLTINYQPLTNSADPTFDELSASKYNWTGLKTLIPLIAFSLIIPQTFAFFSDSATSTNNVFTASPIFTNHIVISEVQARGPNPNGAAKDFVELYNPTSTPFDLNGHRLVRRNGNASSDTTIKSWTSSALIPAHGFYLWANSENGFGTSIGADIMTTQNIGNSASVALRFGAEDTGIIIDAVSWEAAASSLKEGTQFSPSPDAGESIERKALSGSTASSMGSSGADELKGNGFDSDNNATDFILRTLPQPQNSTGLTETP